MCEKPPDENFAATSGLMLNVEPTDVTLGRGKMLGR